MVFDGLMNQMPLVVGYIGYLLYSMGAMVVIGIIALLPAILRQRGWALSLGWFSVCGTVLTYCCFWVVTLFDPFFSAPWFLLLPAVPGGVSLVLLWLQRGKPPVEGHRARVVGALYLVLIVGLIGSLFYLRHLEYYARRDALYEVFDLIELITDVEIDGIDYYEGFFAVTDVRFSIAGRPDTVVSVSEWEILTDYESGDVLNNLSIRRLGPWRFKSERIDVSTEIGDGKSGVGREFLGGVWLGVEGEFVPLVPIEVHSIDDVVEHYDELLAFFEGWPDRDSPGELVLDDEKKLWYYKVPADEAVNLP